MTRIPKGRKEFGAHFQVHQEAKRPLPEGMNKKIDS